MSPVDIVMPCYNSAPWLDAMIESIRAQEGPAWRIIARDDGSSDETPRRLADWRARLGEAMVVLDNPCGENLGIAGSYTAVLRATDAPIVLTADPDDVWLPRHLERAVGALRRLEAEAGAAAPLAITADGAVIDEHGQPIAPSYWRWVRTDPRRVGRVVDLAMESPALGSTMAINRALIEAALPIPPQARAQDWWLALVAAALGRLRALEAVSILYRRHGSNSTAGPFGDSTLRAVWRSLAAPAAARARVRHLMGEITPQAGAFVDRYQDLLPAADVAALRVLAALPTKDPLSRRLAMIRHRFTFASPVKTLGLWALC